MLGAVHTLVKNPQGEGGFCEHQHFFHTLLTFWSDLYYFHGEFLHSQNVFVFFFFLGGGSQKVYGLYTHENGDIYGRPLINIYKCSLQFECTL